LREPRQERSLPAYAGAREHTLPAGNTAGLFGELVGTQQRAANRSGEQLIPAGAGPSGDVGEKADRRYREIIIREDFSVGENMEAACV
jgi:hypothetical protein